MAIEVKWVNHATFRLAGDSVIYIDPWKISGAPHDGELVIISHSHFDHCSPPDARKVLAPSGQVLAPAEVLERLDDRGQVLLAGETIQVGAVKVTGVPAYNIAKAFHPRGNEWLGAVVEMGGVRLYYAGDTDLIPEMSGLKNIDLALLPVGGTYTMNAADAAKAAKAIGCKAAIPYHYGDIVGAAGDGTTFAAAAGCKVHLLKPGESVTI